MGTIILLYLYAYRKGRREEMGEEEISHSLVLDRSLVLDSRL